MLHLNISHPLPPRSLHSLILLHLRLLLRCPRPQLQGVDPTFFRHLFFQQIIHHPMPRGLEFLLECLGGYYDAEMCLNPTNQYDGRGGRWELGGWEGKGEKYLCRCILRFNHSFMM